MSNCFSTTELMELWDYGGVDLNLERRTGHDLHLTSSGLLLSYQSGRANVRFSENRELALNG